MTGPEVLDVAKDAILTLVVVSSPLMLVGLAVGVAISLFQALTQIQEMTLVFVPKILAIFVAMLLALPFMADALQGHMARLAARIVGGCGARHSVPSAARRLLPAGRCRGLHAELRAHRHHGHAAAGARRNDCVAAGASHHRTRAHR